MQVACLCLRICRTSLLSDPPPSPKFSLAILRRPWGSLVYGHSQVTYHMPSMFFPLLFCLLQWVPPCHQILLLPRPSTL